MPNFMHLKDTLKIALSLAVAVALYVIFVQNLLCREYMHAFLLLHAVL